MVYVFRFPFETILIPGFPPNKSPIEPEIQRKAIQVQNLCLIRGDAARVVPFLPPGSVPLDEGADAGPPNMKPEAQKGAEA